MGQKTVLTDTFTDTTLPIIYDDPIMSAGTLILADLTHSLGGVNGLIGNGALIPNIAWSTANQLVAGAPGQAALSLPVQAGAAFGSATLPFAERTPKGGMHVVRSQVNDVTNIAYSLNLPAPVLTYVLSNPNHSYYFSVWQYVTRAAVDATAGLFMLGNNTSNYAFYGVASANFPTTTPPRLLSSTTGSSGLAVGASKLQIAESAYTGTADTIRAGLYFPSGVGGAFNPLHKGWSGVFYRILLEDLSISGRTAAAVKSMDDALYATATAAGGKLYGDTFTDPAGYP